MRVSLTPLLQFLGMNRPGSLPAQQTVGPHILPIRPAPAVAAVAHTTPPAFVEKVPIAPTTPSPATMPTPIEAPVSITTLPGIPTLPSSTERIALMASCIRMRTPKGIVWHVVTKDEQALRALVNSPNREKAQAALMVLIKVSRNLSCLDLRGLNLENQVLKGADFSFSMLQGANLKGVKFNLADFTKANFTGADLSNADLDSSTLDYAIFISANLRGASLNHTSLEGANLTGACLDEADLYGANASGAKFVEATLKNARLCHAECSGADLKKADLTGADAMHADFCEATFMGAVLTRTMFRDDGRMNVAEESRVHFDADLTNADFTNTDLKGALLPRDCADIVFDGAILDDAQRTYILSHNGTLEDEIV